MTKLKTKEKRTFNYTNRHKIKLSDCQVSIEEHDGSNFRIKLILDTKKISIANDQALVLEAFYRGIYDRKTIHNLKDVQDFYLHEFPEKANPSFRLKVISTNTEDEGSIVYSTTFFKATKSEEEQDRDTAFFHPEITSDIGEQIWWVDWDDPLNPVVKLNKDFADKYDINSSHIAQAFIYPAIVREILMGIYFYNESDSFDDLDERSGVARWLKFCKQRLMVEIPGDDEWNDRPAWMEFVNNAIYRFCEEKWDNRRSLTGKLLAKSGK